MREGDQVSTTNPPKRKYRDSGAVESEVSEGDQVKNTPPHQDGKRQRGGGQRSQSCTREKDRSGINRTDRLTGAAQDEVSVGIERTY